MKNAQYDFQFNQETYHWWYQTRRKLVHNLLCSQIFKSKNKDLKILDVGCGTGELLKELGQYGTAYGLDFSNQAVDYCQKRGLSKVGQGSIESIPYPDNFFDIVISLDVLEHIGNDEKGIQEIKRVLKNEGCFIIFVPAFMFLWGISDISSNHFRRYTKKELISKLQKHNLKISKASYFNTFLFLPILAIRILVRIFRPKLEVENEMTNGTLNTLLYRIFSAELPILKYFSLPFGVSFMAVGKKLST